MHEVRVGLILPLQQQNLNLAPRHHKHRDCCMLLLGMCNSRATPLHCERAGMSCARTSRPTAGATDQLVNGPNTNLGTIVLREVRQHRSRDGHQLLKNAQAAFPRTLSRLGTLCIWLDDCDSVPGNLLHNSHPRSIRGPLMPQERVLQSPCRAHPCHCRACWVRLCFIAKWPSTGSSGHTACSRSGDYNSGGPCAGFKQDCWFGHV